MKGFNLCACLAGKACPPIRAQPVDFPIRSGYFIHEGLEFVRFAQVRFFKFKRRKN